MHEVEPESPVQNLIRRGLNLLLHPAETWDAIEAEPDTIERLYKYWAAPLAAIPVVGRMLGALSFWNFSSFQIFGVRFYHPNVIAVLGDAVARYALTLISVYLLALIVDQFAIRFGGERNRTQAFKLVAYSGTAAWVAGVFMLLPTAGGVFALLGGLYSLYLLYLGLPKLMRSAPTFTLNYFALTLVCAIVMWVVIGAVTSHAGDFGGPIHIY
jgi:hypothetical protein